MKAKGVNTIINKDCHRCGHDRFLANGRTKCARCGAGPTNLIKVKNRYGIEIDKVVEAQR